MCLEVGLSESDRIMGALPLSVEESILELRIGWHYQKLRTTWQRGLPEGSGSLGHDLRNSVWYLAPSFLALSLPFCFLVAMVLVDFHHSSLVP